MPLFLHELADYGRFVESSEAGKEDLPLEGLTPNVLGARVGCPSRALTKAQEVFQNMAEPDFSA